MNRVLACEAQSVGWDEYKGGGADEVWQGRIVNFVCNRCVWFQAWRMVNERILMAGMAALSCTHTRRDISTLLGVVVLMQTALSHVGGGAFNIFHLTDVVCCKIILIGMIAVLNSDVLRCKQRCVFSRVPSSV